MQKTSLNCEIHTSNCKKKVWNIRLKVTVTFTYIYINVWWENVCHKCGKKTHKNDRSVHINWL